VRAKNPTIAADIATQLPCSFCTIFVYSFVWRWFCANQCVFQAHAL
jgi:hypothetical protein